MKRYERRKNRNKNNNHYNNNNNSGSSNNSNKNINNNNNNNNSSNNSSSSMEIMEIPGYYYDREKNRYFKILPNQVFGSDHPHSVSKVNEKKKANDSSYYISQEGVFDKHKFLLDREINPFKSYHKNRSEMGEFIVNSYHPVGSLKPRGGIPQKITDFVVNSSRNEIYYGNSQGNFEILKYQADSKSCSKPFEYPFMQVPSEITAIGVNKDALICTTLGSEFGPGKLQLIVRGHDNIANCVQVSNFTSNTTLWTFTLSKTNPLLVIGSSIGAIVLQDYIYNYESHIKFNTKSDVFAVDIDNYQPSIFYTGSRDGRLRIFDIRSGGDCLHIKQSSPICNIKSIGGFYVLCDGMNGSLSLWDSRYIKDEKETKKRLKFVEETKPLVKYFGHVNNSNRRIGFSVNSLESIVAIAGSDKYIRFYSINSGKLIRSPIGPFKDHISTIRFCENNNNNNDDDSNDIINNVIHHYPEIPNKKCEGIWISDTELHWWSV
ncbi:hypothetical protein Glove_494g14 [Diversispora epigaea]|uniref:DUF2415 domain-containing protein n=1 Tax=Diversispora epigaea TaxID=1348612 RepID=A0A397GLN5_9GLOM|nr:hypothetical protein Glove_494g14 [Diversispora epigaea]